jgi:hypothetical protein
LTARRGWAAGGGGTLVALALALASGCSSGAPATDGADASADADGAPVNPGPPLTYLPTYSAVWGEILQPTCALLFCHAGSEDYLELTTKDLAYEALVGAPATGTLCGPTGLERVDPGHPETSLLYLKITDPPCGSKMPLQYGAPVVLDPRQLSQIHDWIAAGALDN